MTLTTHGRARIADSGLCWLLWRKKKIEAWKPSVAFARDFLISVASVRPGESLLSLSS